MRVLFGYDNGKPCATIMSSKEEIDSQFWYPRRNKVIKDYKNIKDNYSCFSEDDSELVSKNQLKTCLLQKFMNFFEKIKKNGQY